MCEQCKKTGDALLELSKSAMKVNLYKPTLKPINCSRVLSGFFFNGGVPHLVIKEVKSREQVLHFRVYGPSNHI